MAPADYKLRYYFNRSLLEGVLGDEERRIYNVTLMLLEEVKRRTGIGYEVYLFTSGEEVLIYKEHFASRSRLLNRIHDLTVSRALKSRSGHVYLHSLVAITRGGEVVWYHEGWTRDYEEWRRRAEAIRVRHGLRFAPLHLGFLAMAAEEPGYLAGIINAVEQALRQSPVRIRSHDVLVFRVVERILSQSGSRAAIFIEMPLGVKLLAQALGYDGQAVYSRYDWAARSVLLSAYPLRADIVVVYGPQSLQAGIYPCARGLDQAYRLERLYAARFPGWRVTPLGIGDLESLTLRGESIEIIEVKTGRVGEQAIGQLLTYEALVRIDAPGTPIRKTIAAPREQIEHMNPLLKLITQALGIGLMPL